MLCFSDLEASCRAHFRGFSWSDYMGNSWSVYRLSQNLAFQSLSLQMISIKIYAIQNPYVCSPRSPHFMIIAGHMLCTCLEHFSRS